jgi:hypothetical protein
MLERFGNKIAPFGWLKKVRAKGAFVASYAYAKALKQRQGLRGNSSKGCRAGHWSTSDW